jgi:hypothetical protein
MTAPAAPPAPAEPGGREPIPSGAPPGPPSRGAPFQSALEAESARTAIAEGQRQSHTEGPPAPAKDPGTGSAGATGRGDPSKPAGHRSRVGIGTGSTAASRAPSAPAESPTGTLALQPPGGTAAAEPEPGASAQGGAIPRADARLTLSATGGEVAERLDGAGGSTAATSALGSGSGGDPAAGLGGPSEVRGPQGAGSDSSPRGDAAAPAAGVALPGAPGGPDPTAPGGLLARGWTGSEPRAGVGPDAGGAGSDPRGRAGSGSRADRGAPSPPPPPDPSTGEALSATHIAGTRPGGAGYWRAPAAGARQPAGQGGIGPAGGAGAHDKLWVPEPAQTSADTGPGGAGGLAEAAADPAAPGGDQAPILDYGAGLQQAIEALHGTIQLAASQGLSQARITLQPEELGEIRIHLTQTDQGLIARVTAETPAATQALAAAHAELRQSLSSLGIDLARLSIGRHDHSAAQGGGTALGGGHGGAAGSGETSSHRNRPAQSTPATAPTDPAPEGEAEEGAPAAPALSRGTLVDVLA